MSKPIVLVLGAGANVGSALASIFGQSGYGIALAARSLGDSKSAEGHLNVTVDLSDPSSIPTVFEKIKKELGTPNIVIYNAAASTPPPDPESLFSLSVESLQRDLNLTTLSAYAAAKEAVAGFDTLPKETRKVFIYTGNILNTKILPVPALTTLGVGKAASAYWIGTASAAYAEKGYKFFYADQRTPEGKHVGNSVDGPAHAEFYYKLASEETTIPWGATFVKGKGYVDFSN